MANSCGLKFLMKGALSFLMKKTLPDSDMIDDNVHTQYQAFQLFYKIFAMYIIYGHI